MAGSQGKTVMTDAWIGFQIWFWHHALRGAPTCCLQWALEKREGVQSITLGPDEDLRVLAIRGPCTITINRD